MINKALNGNFETGALSEHKPEQSYEEQNLCSALGPNFPYPSYQSLGGVRGVVD